MREAQSSGEVPGSAATYFIAWLALFADQNKEPQKQSLVPVELCAVALKR
jgi:hypothetical protein